LEELSKESRITSINWADEACNEILIGRADKVIRTFDCQKNVFSETDLEVPGDGKSIVGLTWNDESIIAATDVGKIHILLNETPSVIETGDNLSKMRSCKQNKNIVAVGGKERKNNLKIFDLESKKEIFSCKNVPHDTLQLEVPVWESDLCFVNDNEFCLSTCSRYGYVRFYDRRQQRRPVLNYTDKKDLAFSCMTEANG
jgi:ribosome biogenesis protein NSA1